ncbi:hypothetical protein MASR2M29_21950 [Spirochaetota bacterium]
MKYLFYPLLFFSLLLASCIGIDSESNIRADGTIQLKLIYSVSKAVDELGRLGANEVYFPLPVGREDLQLAAGRSGAELRSWNRNDNDDKIIITANLDFPDPDSFTAFLDPAGGMAEFSKSNGLNTLTLTLTKGTTVAEPDFLEFIKAVFGDYEIVLNFRLPGTIVNANGFTLNGNNASFKMKAADVYSSPKAVVLSLSWKNS